MTPKLSPYPGQIILTPYDPKSASGLSLARTKDDPRFGEVYDFGEPVKKEHRDIKLKKGQKIIFAKYITEPLYVVETGEYYYFIEYEDLRCSIE